MPRSIHFSRRRRYLILDNSINLCTLLVGLVLPRHVSVTCRPTYVQCLEVLPAPDASVTGKLTACVYIDILVLHLIVNLFNEQLCPH